MTDRTARDDELAEAKARASYWKQRAKSAEGHLFASDTGAAARAVHSASSHSETPWSGLTDEQRHAFEFVAVRVIAAVNVRRDGRKPMTGRGY